MSPPTVLQNAGRTASSRTARSESLSQAFLSASGTRLVDGQGATVQLRGVALGGWLFNETWISAVDFNLHNRLAVLGDRAGIGSEVRLALTGLGPYEGPPDDTAQLAGYLEAFTEALSPYTTTLQAEELASEAWEYPLLYDDSDRYLLDALEARFGTSGRDSLHGIFQDSWITEWDIQFIREMGFNTVRVPMSYRDLMNVSQYAPLEPPATFKESAFQRIDRLLTWCEKYGVYAVLDIQEAPGGQNSYAGEGTGTLYSDPVMQELTLELWTYISARYKDRWVVAAYSLLAEPMSAPSVEVMMTMYDRLYQAIRGQGDEHLMVIHDGFKGLGKLKSPRAMGWHDVIYSTHLFEWGVKSYAEYKAIIKAYELLFQQTQRRQQVPYYIGSFSVMVDEDWAYQGLEDYLNAFDRNGWSWTLWTYKRIDDPLEQELWGTSTSWGIWQRVKEDALWQRADVYLDGQQALSDKLGGYGTDQLELNPAMYEILHRQLTEGLR